MSDRFDVFNPYILPAAVTVFSRATRCAPRTGGPFGPAIRRIVFWGADEPNPVLPDEPYSFLGVRGNAPENE